METALVNWIQEERKSGLAVPGLLIKMRTKEILKSMNNGNEPTDIKASNCWLDRFLKRLILSVEQ